MCEQGRLDEALARYREALICKPDLAEAHNNLGNVFRELGRLEEATVSFRDVLRIKPDFAEAHNNLAMLLLLRGEFAEGWREYEWRAGKPGTSADSDNSRNRSGRASIYRTARSFCMPNRDWAIPSSSSVLPGSSNSGSARSCANARPA